MKKCVSAYATILVLVISGCYSTNSIKSSDLKAYEVKNIIDETRQGDFVFRLVSEKEQYKKGEDVRMYGEIEYTGEKDEITIHHSSSAILFQLTEEIRAYDIDYGVKDIGVSTTLKQGEPYREEYEKMAIYSADDPNDYVRFIEDFLERDGFPLGYYVVNGQTDFSVASDQGVEDEERVNMDAAIDFKVAE